MSVGGAIAAGAGLVLVAFALGFMAGYRSGKKAGKKESSEGSDSSPANP